MKADVFAKFEPQKDITAYELAIIAAKCPLREAHYKGIWFTLDQWCRFDMKRHFRLQQGHVYHASRWERFCEVLYKTLGGKYA